MNRKNTILISSLKTILFAATGLGDLLSSNDANCTYEGENHVLIQQTANWLLKYWPLVLSGSNISSPLKTIDFLTNAKEILNNKWKIDDVETLCSSKGIYYK